MCITKEYNKTSYPGFARQIWFLLGFQLAQNEIVSNDSRYLILTVSEIFFAKYLNWFHFQTTENIADNLTESRPICWQQNTNSTYLSCVSQTVPCSNLNKSLKSVKEKCFSTSSSRSTTHELKAFLCSCLWNIFSSIVPTANKR